MQATNSCIVLRDVSVRYGRRLALEAVSGEFAAGSMTAVVGGNGAGKSTLLAAIAGIVPLARGAVTRAARPRLAYLPQYATLDREYPVTVAELIALGGWREFGAFRAPNRSLRARVLAVADRLGVTGRLGRAIGETIATTMVIGNRPEIAASLFAPSYTLASVIANEFTEANGDVYISALLELGLLLFIVSFIVNGMARLLLFTVLKGDRA